MNNNSKTQDQFSVYERSDVKTLKPFMRRMERFHQAIYEEVVADAGYESLENYLYLESNGQLCFIKPANYDQKRTGKFKKQQRIVIVERLAEELNRA